MRGVLARSEASRRAFIDAHGLDARSYASLDEVLADDGVDFVILTTPPNARVEIMQRLAAAKMPILLEKPIERTLDVAVELVELCEGAEIPLGMVLQHRLKPAALKMRALVDSGALGPLHAAEINVPWWRPQSYYEEKGRGTYARDGGGVMLSQAIHPMDLALSLTGPVASVTALSATTGIHRMESEDFVSAGLRFVNGAVGTLFATTAAYPGWPEFMRLHHDKAVLTLESNQLTVNWRDGRSETSGAVESAGGGADPMAFSTNRHTAVIADFVEALETDRPPAIPGRAALPVHALIEAIERSARQGGVAEVRQ